MSEFKATKRLAESRLRELLADTRVVLVVGPRQSGKTTLVHQAFPNRTYLTFDIETNRAAAKKNPDGFLAAHPPPLTLDEVQRAPEVFPAIKARIDMNPTSGSYLLTGSADVLTFPQIVDSLAGRMESLELWPLAQVEIERDNFNFVDQVFGVDRIPAVTQETTRLVERMQDGGFPEPLFKRKSAARRLDWALSYTAGIVERDLRDMARLSDVERVHILLKQLAIRNGESVNERSLSRETGIPDTTLKRYLQLLRRLYLIFEVPAWTQNPAASPLKAPKVYMVDSLIAASLSARPTNANGVDDLRAFTAAELKRLIAVSETRPKLFHFRSARDSAVDFVLQSPLGHLVAIHVTENPRPGADDLRPLEFFQGVAPVHRAVLLHPGFESSVPSKPYEIAPIRTLWSQRKPSP